MSRLYLIICLVLGLAGLPGCTAASTPRMIASYPRGLTTAPAPAREQVVGGPALAYDAYLHLEVSHTDRAAEQAERLAYDSGGYLVSSQIWESEGLRYATLVFSVPPSNFNALHTALSGLGDLKSERVTGSLYSSNSGWARSSQITLHLSPKTSLFPPASLAGWRPFRTFDHAWKVLVTIVSFLADILIWVLVVAGPFVLLGLGIRLVVQRVRARRS